MIGALWVFLLLVISIVLSGLESALLTVDRARVRSRAQTELAGARKLESLMEQRNDLLVSVLILNNACSLIAFAITAYMLSHWLGPIGYLVCFLVFLPIYVIWMELLPKSVFQHFPYRSLHSCLPLLSALNWTLGPLVRLGHKVMTTIWKRPQPEVEASEEQERLEQEREIFRAMTDSIQRDGVLDEDEAGLIQRVLDFSDVTAEDVMMPLTRVTCVPLDMPAESMVNLAKETGFDQFPVISESGDLIGIVRIFEILQTEDRERLQASNFLRSLVRTQATEKAIRVLQRLRQAHVELAIVSDKSGRAKGIISSHDIAHSMMGAE